MFNRVSLALNKIARNEHARFHLNGVNVRPGCTEATNGHQAVRITAPEGKAEDFPLSKAGEATVDDFPPFLMPADAAEKVLKAIPNGRHAVPAIRNAAVLPPHNGTVRLIVTDLESEQVFQVTPLEGKFPDLDAVFPKDPPVLQIGFSVEELALHLDVAKAAGVKWIRFGFHAPDKAVETNGRNTDTDQQFLGVIMPCDIKAV